MITTVALRRALAELRRNLALLEGDLARQHPDLIPTFRSAAIQSFEYSYELALRLLFRAIEDRQGVGMVDEADFRTRIRMGIEAGLVASLDDWITFRTMRNATSHAYNEQTALEVCVGLPGFVSSVTALLAQLEDHAHAS